MHLHTKYNASGVAKGIYGVKTSHWLRKKKNF